MYLYDTEIVGNIKSLAKSLWLQYLDLEGTKIHGDLNAFQSMGRLYRLNLGNTRISGDLSAFEYYSYRNEGAVLEVLDLENTGVTGQLSDLVAYLNGQLKRLNLHGTAVTGNLVDITKFDHIQKAGGQRGQHVGRYGKG